MSLKLKIKSILKKIYYYGNRYICPVCNYHARSFLDAGLYEKRKESKCPNCGSLERQRIIWMYLNNSAINRNSVLHFAPENCLSDAFNKQGSNYFISEFNQSKKADYHIDLESIEIKAQFDLIICSHVLEHVANDVKALRGLHSLLADEGKLLLMVPLWPSEEHNTYENKSITDPRDRTIHFGQYDHVRIYGLDIVEKIKSCGFQVDVIDYINDKDKSFIEKNRLQNPTMIRELIFECTK